MATLHILMDNLAHEPSLYKDEALSMALRLDDGSLFLWDTGGDRRFLDNAKAMGLDLGSAVAMGLSHGHYDHTGGLAALLAETDFAGPIYGHPDMNRPRYSIKPGTNSRFIGVDTDALPWPPDNFVPVTGSREILPGLTLFTDIPRLEGNCSCCKHFYFDTLGANPDQVADDACLALATDKGPVLILGCCHSGLANTLTHVAQTMGVDSFHAVLGGMHLYDSGPEDVLQAISGFKAFNVERLYPGHCTGEAAMLHIKDILPDQTTFLGSGLVIEL